MGASSTLFGSNSLMAEPPDLDDLETFLQETCDLSPFCTGGVAFDPQIDSAELERAIKEMAKGVPLSQGIIGIDRELSAAHDEQKRYDTLSAIQDGIESYRDQIHRELNQLNAEDQVARDESGVARGRQLEAEIDSLNTAMDTLSDAMADAVRKGASSAPKEGISPAAASITIQPSVASPDRHRAIIIWTPPGE